MEFKKKSKVKTEIPTSSMPDIVFQLLLFFMVSTVFKQYTGLPVDLPTAKRIEKIEAKKNVTHVYANLQGEISIDDKLIETRDVTTIMYQKMVENPRMLTTFKFDRGLRMGVVSDIQEKLRDAGALQVYYCAKTGI